MILNRIKELIEDSGMSNTDFARKTGLNPSIISHILSGRNKVSLQVIEHIAKNFTNVNVSYLITGEGKLYGSVTNVKNADAPARASEEVGGISTGFPMEGVRNAAIPGSLPETYKPDVKTEAAVENNELSTPPGQKEKPESEEIDKVIILYKDGSFKAYRP